MFVQTTKSSMASEPGALPRFKASAADQLDRRHSDRFAGMRMKLRSAFTPSQPVVNARMFAGRGEILQTMIGSLEDQKLHLVVYGQRGIGKTSLMHMLANAAREARYIVHYSSCGASSNFQETFRAAAQDIPLLYHGGYGPTAEEAEAGSTFADLLPEGDFSPRQFGELCARLTGTRVLIILDEFDRSDSKEFRRELAELMKTLSDRTVRVQVIVAGVAGDLAELVEHIPSIRRNILAVRVPQFTEAEILEFVAAGEAAIGLTFEKGARDLICRTACGSPYFVSLICHHAGLEALDAGRSSVQTIDVTRAVAHVLGDLRDRIGKTHRAQLERLIGEGFGGLVAVIAGAALRAGGEFEVSDIDAIAATQVEATSAKRLLDQLAAGGALFTVQEEGTQRKYAATVDGLPAYLWFQGVLQDFEDEQHPNVSNG